MRQSIKVKIIDLSRGGAGVAKLDSGEVVFVPLTAPGDEVLIHIIDKKKSYCQGELIEIVTPSPLRVKPPCEVFGTCGGCSWQHLPYSLQFETKKKGLLHSLKRAGVQDIESLQIDEMPSDEPFHYRNRIQLRGDPLQKTIGFFSKNSSTLVPIERCEIADQRINHELPQLKKHAEQEFKRGYKVEIQVSEEGAVQAAWNQGHAAFGFRQINDRQNEKLKQWVQKNAGSGSLLLDLFGGSGNLSIPLISHFQEIHCVDVSAPQENLTSSSYFHFHQKNVLGWLTSLTPQKTASSTLPAATVILDPPREGLASEFHEIYSKLTQNFQIEKVLLVGCNVDSFSRDTGHFIQAGLQLKAIGVLDLFPQTPHVESLALFTK